LSALGEIERLDAIITADTGWERRATYAARDWYIDWFRGKGLRVEVVGGRDIRVEGADRSIHIPFWTSSGGPLRRECTREFKIRPLRRRARELIGLHASLPPNPPKAAIEKWLGYTWEEVGRQKKSDVQYVIKRYPLIELRWTRRDCERFLHDRGLPVPVKSACVACPFRTAAEYLEMREQGSEEFAEAVAFDERNRHNPLAERCGSTADELFVYKQASTQRPVPLADADLEGDAAWSVRKGEQLMLQLCEGPCGT
jgi:hypothetical protein